VLIDAQTPEAPRGNELLFGLAAGASLPLGDSHRWTIAGGPELYGATAVHSLFDAGTTSLEGLLSARFEGVRDDGLPIRLKLGVGAGLHQRFGAPEWRGSRSSAARTEVAGRSAHDERA
jgi:hypothetical protein